jgi:hypothetical protein
MLLPNFSFLPNRDLRLGTILTSVKGSKLPDPRRPLNTSTRKEVCTSDIHSQNFKPWNWDSSRYISAGVTLRADVSILTGFGGSVSKEASKDKNLAIKCDSMNITSFRPDTKYLAQAVQDDIVKAIGQKLLGPPLYMVVGLMIANGAEITVSQERSSGYSKNLSLDGTSVGVPLAVGPNAGYNRSSSMSHASVPTEPFILAYEIIRMRMKRDGTVKEHDENKWALFSDEESGCREQDHVADFEKHWAVEAVHLHDTMTVDPRRTAAVS